MILRGTLLDKKQNIHTVDTKQIAKNTLMLYFRQLLVMLVSLYSVRVVLNTLGADDYGLYNVVAGIVAMFGFVSASMAGTCQRYFSFSLGKNDFDELHKIFNLTIAIYIIITVVIVFFSETIGLWFVYTKLKIAAERVSTAKWVYQFSILSLVLTILTTPFMAMLIAYEDMNIYAYVGIIEAFLKLCVALILQVLPWDKLWLYGLLMLLVTIVTTTIYRTVCKLKYKACKYKFYWNTLQARSMMSFIGWNIIGVASDVGKNQGVNTLLNQYFNPIVTTSRSIAMQVSGAVSSFSQNFSAALNPQIIKNYAAGSNTEMLNLLYKGCRFTYFLMLFFALPLLVEMESILAFWLQVVPDYAVVFTQLILIKALLEALCYPMITAVQATGNIKTYQCLIGGILLLNFPLAWLILGMGKGPIFVVVLDLILICCAVIARLMINKKLIKLSLLIFFKKVLFPILGVTTISSVLAFIWLCLNLHFFLVIMGCAFSTATSIFCFGLTHNERLYLIHTIKAKLRYFERC